MNHLHAKTGKIYEVAIMDDFDGSTFDMCVITKWDPNFNESPTLVDYYFGEYNKELTDYCIDKFIANQEQLKKAMARLEGLRLVDHEVMEADDLQDLDETIKSIHHMISYLY